MAREMARLSPESAHHTASPKATSTFAGSRLGSQAREGAQAAGRDGKGPGGSWRQGGLNTTPAVISENHFLASTDSKRGAMAMTPPSWPLPYASGQGKGQVHRQSQEKERQLPPPPLPPCLALCPLFPCSPPSPRPKGARYLPPGCLATVVPRRGVGIGPEAAVVREWRDSWRGLQGDVGFGEGRPRRARFLRQREARALGRAEQSL